MSEDAPRVTIRLPSVLKVMVGRDRIPVRARTVQAALDAAFDALPALRHHLAHEAGGLRPHVLCLVNEKHVPRDALATTPVEEGDVIQIWQAITGG